MPAYNAKTDRKVPFRVSLEILLSSNQKRYALGSSQQLNKPSVRLHKIMAYPKTNNTTSPSGVAIASQTTYDQTYLTLQDPGSNNIVQQECLTFYQINTDIKPVREFEGQQVDFTKSYIEFPDTTQPTADNGKVIVLDIEYDDLDANN
jgi:hypothetical protein